MTISERLRRTRDRYANGADRPLAGYLGAMGAYGALIGATVVVGRARGARLPVRIPWSDIALLSTAAHKASRLLSKDAVTSPLRAPFTEYQEPAGEGELNESVPGHGFRHAAGELLTCPFCMAVWTSTALAAGLVLAPRSTRLACAVLTSAAAADTLHLVYDTLKRHAEG